VLIEKKKQGTRHAEFVALCEIMSRHHPSILHTTDLYVTVEPCVMCASALRQFGIRSVYFGCLNDRFGGTGGVMTVHMDEGVDPPYPVYGGLFREEAIMLLRRFYVQENDKGKSSAAIRGLERRSRLTLYSQHRSRNPRRTVSSRRRSCLLVCRLEAILRPTWSRLLLDYPLLVNLLLARPPSRHPLVEVDTLSSKDRKRRR
jgi:pyrimidine deaminase RibD-like protein